MVMYGRNQQNVVKPIPCNKKFKEKKISRVRGTEKDKKRVYLKMSRKSPSKEVTLNRERP